MRDGFRHFDTQLGILHPDICSDTAAADETHSIILLSVEKMDVDDELRRHVSSLRQLVLSNELPKEGLVEMEGYGEEVLQYTYDMNEVGTQVWVDDATSQCHGWEFFPGKSRSCRLF